MRKSLNRKIKYSSLKNLKKLRKIPISWKDEIKFYDMNEPLKIFKIPAFLDLLRVKLTRRPQKCVFHQNYLIFQ